MLVGPRDANQHYVQLKGREGALLLDGSGKPILDYHITTGVDDALWTTWSTDHATDPLLIQGYVIKVA